MQGLRKAYAIRHTVQYARQMQVLWGAYAMVTQVRLMQGTCKETYNMLDKCRFYGRHMLDICKAHPQKDIG
jgi:hypothetical protein